MATATLADIRNGMLTQLKALIPTTFGGHKFHTFTSKHDIRRWAAEDRAGSHVLRAMQVHSPSSGDRAEVTDPSMVRRIRPVIVTVTYPAMYGMSSEQTIDDFRDEVDADAVLIETTLYSGDVYPTGVDDQKPIGFQVTPGEKVWFLEVGFRVIYNQAQNWTAAA